MRNELKAIVAELGSNAASIKSQLTEALKPYASHLEGKSVGETVDEVFSAISTALKAQVGDVGDAPVTPKPEPEVAARAARPEPVQPSFNGIPAPKALKPFPEDHGLGCAKCCEEAPSVKFNVDGDGNESLVWTCDDGCGAIYETLCRDA